MYLAERHDGQVRQPGAIKFLNGTVHSRDLQLRFLDERQILANLNHPGIVRLIDAGLMPDGQAYLVMEYIEDALPVDVYCRKRGLTVRERIAMFRQVCEAVEYAHRKLVVHRDLKPGNILVTSDGNPRLLDFGVATNTRRVASRGRAGSFEHECSSRNGAIFQPRTGAP